MSDPVLGPTQLLGSLLSCGNEFHRLQQSKGILCHHALGYVCCPLQSVNTTYTDAQGICSGGKSESQQMGRGDCEFTHHPGNKEHTPDSQA